MADRVVEEHLRVQAFRTLVSSTLGALRDVRAQAALANALDQYLPAWEKADAEFATVLRQLRSQVFNLGLPHLRAVASTLCEHLQVNLERIEKGLHGGGGEIR